MIDFHPFLIIAVGIIITYAVLISTFINGWKKIPYFENKDTEISTTATIITACKNEINRLPYLFQAINEQTYRNFEMILVDDHSTDGSYEYCREVAHGFPQLKVVKSSGFGKKNAVKTGVYQAENELIISLDADSIPTSDWLKTIVGFYENSPADLIICPIRIESDGTFFQNFQQFEFASLIGCGAGAAGNGMPIFCNGANMTFTREAWLSSESELHFEEMSGDDIFLLQSLKKRKRPIRFLKSSDAGTTTNPAPDLKSFLRQRKRWASKKTAYLDRHLFVTGIIVFLASVTVFTTLLISLFSPKFFTLFLSIFLIKFITDGIFFSRFKTFFNLKNAWKNTLIFSFVYPVYILYTACISFLGKKQQVW